LPCGTARPSCAVIDSFSWLNAKTKHLRRRGGLIEHRFFTGTAWMIFNAFSRRQKAIHRGLYENSQSLGGASCDATQARRSKILKKATLSKVLPNWLFMSLWLPLSSSRHTRQRQPTVGVRPPHLCSLRSQPCAASRRDKNAGQLPAIPILFLLQSRPA